jgi:hypothetical protein
MGYLCLAPKGQVYRAEFFQLEKSLSEKERSALELGQKLESEKQAIQSTKSMLDNKISEVQSLKSESQDFKHQVNRMVEQKQLKRLTNVKSFG